MCIDRQAMKRLRLRKRLLSNGWNAAAADRYARIQYPRAEPKPTNNRSGAARRD